MNTTQHSHSTTSFARKPSYLTKFFRPFTHVGLLCGLLANAPSVSAQIFEFVPLSVPATAVPEVVSPAMSSSTPQRHLGDLGNGPIDIKALPPDVLQCDVCRRRLGLAPLNSNEKVQVVPQTTKTAKSETKPLSTPSTEGLASQSPNQNPAVRMLGSPGIISSVTAEQLAKGEFVVEEFKPPQSPADAIQLDGIPYEIRQQFIQGLQLPYGAKVMSAKVQDGIKNDTNEQEASAAATNNVAATESVVPRPAVADAIQVDSSEPRSLGGPGIVPKIESPLPPPVEEHASQEAVQSAATSPAPQVAQEKEMAPTAPSKNEEPKASEPARNNELIAQRQAFEESLNRMKAEWEARMTQADAVNKEVLTMLEKRTAEVTELQVQLKAQQELIAKTKAELEAKSREAESKKKEPKKSPAKNKQPTKTSIST